MALHNLENQLYKEKNTPWTLEEQFFKSKQDRYKEVRTKNIPFTNSLMHKLKKSVFGGFLKELNIKQIFTPELNENKLHILDWQIKKYNKHDFNIIEERNKLFRKYLANLRNGVTKKLEINLKYLEKTMKELFLDTCFIKSLDESLHKFKSLTVLTLCGNYLQDIDGSTFPKRLIFLELYDNFIENLERFCNNLPKCLMHIGLGRNKLADDSQFHLLHTTATLPLLKSLDLSDNDICCLSRILEDLKLIKTLSSLSLEGNPCWVVPNYKNEVLLNLPHLVYLDQTSLLVEDKQNLSFKQKEPPPQVKFCGFRVLGLPEPPKDAKNAGVFYFEVNFPLLVKALPLSKEVLEEPKEDQKSKEKRDMKSKNNGKEKDNHSKREDIDKDTNKSSKKSKKSDDKSGVETKASKKGKKSYYKGPNEYNAKEEKRNVWFKTERQKWSKIMEFPEIIVESPIKENDLTLIRDTFRCQVEVRLIYLKIAPKPLRKNLSKDANKQIKKSKKSELTNVENGAVGDESQETILKKSTIAYFQCDLKSINWSEPTLDFYWADHPEFGRHALRVDGSLKAIEYESIADQKKGQKKLKAKDYFDNTIAESTATPKESFPKILTCQIGIGLFRI